MRHFFLAAAMLVGALVVTSVASTALQSWATSRAHASSYQPPSLVASPASINKKSDGTVNGLQRARPTLAVRADRPV
jgi:hypothetical protein